MKILPIYLDVSTNGRIWNWLIHKSSNTGISYFLHVFSSTSTIPYNWEEILLILILILPARKGKKEETAVWQRRRFERICYSIFQETLNVKIENPPTVAKFHNLLILTKRIFWRTIFRNGNKSSIPFFFFRKIQKFKIRQNMPPDPVGKQWKFCNFANFVLPWEPESFFSLATSSFVHHRLTRLRPKVEDTSSIFKT